MSRTQPIAKTSQHRIERMFYVFAGLFVLCGARVAWMQTMTRASATTMSDAAFERAQLLPARRGQLLARDGTAMAVTIDEYTIAANPRGWSAQEKDKAIAELAKTIGGDTVAMRAKLDEVTRPNGTKNYYVKLAEHVDEERADRLRKLMGPQKNELRKDRTARKKFWETLSVEASPRRHYPLGAFAPQLIGFTTNSGLGADGMESAWQKTLGGENGEREALVDAQGRAVPGSVRVWKEPTDGKTIETAIDPKIQQAADQTLMDTWKKYKPNFCVAVVMKPDTGEIVAVSTAPNFDLNHRPKDMVEVATNRAFSYAYEPGSTWKIITAAAAVENVPNWQSRSFYINGSAPAGNHVIHDWQFWSGKVQAGQKTLSDGIRDSSNVCMWHFAQLMPRNVLPDYAKKFGIGTKPELPGFNIAPGYLPRSNPKTWSLAQWANFSFGQGMMITPLQLAQIGSVIANDGVMMKPMLIKQVRNSRGQVLQTFKPEVDHRVIQVNTAREVKKMLRRVVAEGTARKYIFIPGYDAAGKTGSAQKAVGKTGYRAGKFISSFVGLLPMNKPKYVIAVMADEPHGSHWGSEVCGPAFTNIAQEAVTAMRLEEGSDAPAPNPNLMERPTGKTH
ncbi:penicillin-binding protein 2 [bacterium]|nr:MAG: penicillin-binding protein 2 [bacterium]